VTLQPKKYYQERTIFIRTFFLVFTRNSVYLHNGINETSWVVAQTMLIFFQCGLGGYSKNKFLIPKPS